MTTQYIGSEIGEALYTGQPLLVAVIDGALTAAVLGTGLPDSMGRGLANMMPTGAQSMVYWITLGFTSAVITVYFKNFIGSAITAARTGRARQWHGRA